MLVWPQQDELGAAAVVAALRRGSAAMIPDARGRDVLLGTADQRRAQMLHAALDIISERGYAETRIADVAERAGVSPALVIYYYKTKDQLLAEAGPELNDSSQLWLDFWSQAARNEAVASVRRNADERWREAIASLVRAGQNAGEFADIDAASFAICLSALLDGLTVQLALRDPVVDGARAFELTMRFVAGQLGFSWHPRRNVDA